MVLGGLDQTCPVCSGHFKWLNFNHACTNITPQSTKHKAQDTLSVPTLNQAPHLPPYQVLLRRGAWDSWVTAKARLELDPRSQGATGAGGVRLQLFRKRLTTSQDARFTAGLDWDYTGSGGGLKQVGAGDPRHMHTLGPIGWGGPETCNLCLGGWDAPWCYGLTVCVWHAMVQHVCAVRAVQRPGQVYLASYVAANCWLCGEAACRGGYHGMPTTSVWQAWEMHTQAGLHCQVAAGPVWCALLPPAYVGNLS